MFTLCIRCLRLTYLKLVVSSQTAVPLISNKRLALKERVLNIHSMFKDNCLHTSLHGHAGCSGLFKKAEQPALILHACCIACHSMKHLQRFAGGHAQCLYIFVSAK